jgi:hypothetical protein
VARCWRLRRACDAKLTRCWPCGPAQRPQQCTWDAQHTRAAGA